MDCVIYATVGSNRFSLLLLFHFTTIWNFNPIPFTAFCSHTGVTCVNSGTPFFRIRTRTLIARTWIWFCDTWNANCRLKIWFSWFRGCFGLSLHFFILKIYKFHPIPNLDWLILWVLVCLFECMPSQRKQSGSPVIRILRHILGWCYIVKPPF